MIKAVKKRNKRRLDCISHSFEKDGHHGRTS